MDAHQQILNLFYDRMSVNLDNEINFEKIFKVIKTRDTFARYTQLNEYNTSNHSSTDRTELLKSIITNECELKEFISILLHTGHDTIAQELDPKVIDLCDLTRCDPESQHKNNFSFGDTNTLDTLKTKDVSNSFSGSIYRMTSSPRGYCYLINNYFTIGTYKEMQRLRNIFYQLHFHIEMRKNLTINQITDLLTDLSKSPELSGHDAFMFIIITYGDNKQISDSNNDSIDIFKLTQLFDDENCPQMKRKPRLFFFNCCENETLKECAKMTEMTEKSKICSPSDDIFICVSTLDKTISWDKGTQFGRQFVNALVERACYRDIIYLTTRTNHHLELIFGKSIERTILNKTLYLNNLTDLKRINVPSITGDSTTTIETLEDFMLEGWGKSLDQNILIQLLEQLCKELKIMHMNGVFHKNINPQSIEISIPVAIRQKEDIIVGDFGNTKIQLKHSSSDYGNLCWKSPEVLETLKNKKNFEASKENDIFCLGCIIYYVMTRGQHPFDNKLDMTKSGMILNALSGDQNQIYVDLIERMLEYNKTDRPSIDVVSTHPMFWKSNIILQFYTDIKNLFHAKNDKGMQTTNFKNIQKRVINDLKTKSRTVYGDDWLKKLSIEIQTHEKTKIKNSIRDSTSYIDLIDYIRNKDQHYDEWHKDYKQIFGETVDSYIKYFTDRFPLLLINTYNTMKVFKAERKLENYYI